MAIDTAAKRWSITHLGCPWRGILPPPDGSNTVGDRIHNLYLYSGITPVPVRGRKEYTMPFALVDYTMSRGIPDYTLPKSVSDYTQVDE